MDGRRRRGGRRKDGGGPRTGGGGGREWERGDRGDRRWGKAGSRGGAAGRWTERVHRRSRRTPGRLQRSVHMRRASGGRQGRARPRRRHLRIRDMRASDPVGSTHIPDPQGKGAARGSRRRRESGITVRTRVVRWAYHQGRSRSRADIGELGGAQQAGRVRSDQREPVLGRGARSADRLNRLQHVGRALEPPGRRPQHRCQADCTPGGSRERSPADCTPGGSRERSPAMQGSPPRHCRTPVPGSRRRGRSTRWRSPARAC
jgi:hypothetical protein